MMIIIVILLKLMHVTMTTPVKNVAVLEGA
jgi:hypothetical protein